MKKILIKLLLKFIGENPLAMMSDDGKKEIQDWLFDSFKNRGQKSYYTLRKKCIHNELSTGMSQEEYWKRIGRLDELRALNENIETEAKRRDREKKQHETT